MARSDEPFPHAAIFKVAKASTPKPKDTNADKAIDKSELFRQIVAYSGLDVKEAGTLLREAVNTAQKHLTAEKTTYFQSGGVITDERADVDANVQLKAAGFLKDAILDIYGERKGEGGSQSPNITINLQNWFDEEKPPSEKDVTP